MENLDNKLNISAGFIVSGNRGDIERLRKLILDFLGAEMTPQGYIHQRTPSTSIRLIYHTLSRKRLFLVKEEPFKKPADSPASQPKWAPTNPPKWIHEQG